MAQTRAELTAKHNEWVRNNREKENAIRRRSYEKHKEKRKAERRAWWAANPELAREELRRRRDNSPERYLWNAAKSRCKKSGVTFTITIDDIVIPEFCPVLGIKLAFETSRGPNTPSLDRVIPALGYIPGNVRVISYRANMVKGDSTLEELKKLVTYIEEHNVQDHRD